MILWERIESNTSLLCLTWKGALTKFLCWCWESEYFQMQTVRGILVLTPHLWTEAAGLTRLLPQFPVFFKAQNGFLSCNKPSLTFPVHCYLFFLNSYKTFALGSYIHYLRFHLPFYMMETTISTSLTRLLWCFNEIIHVKDLARCLTHSKFS